MVSIEIVTTKIRWPRGLAFAEEELFVLARGLHRKEGGPNPDIEDDAGSIFKVNKSIRKSNPGEPNQKIVNNGELFAPPTDPPFFLWNKRATPKFLDTRTDRPYATLVYEPVTKNFFICGYSGIDFVDSSGRPSFRKNASDTIHRYSLDKSAWFGVECHNRYVVPEYRLGQWINDDGKYYPHHNANDNIPPHGILNGADGLCALYPNLFAVAKDNNVLVNYNISQLKDVGLNENPYLNGSVEKKFGASHPVRVRGNTEQLYLRAPSGIAIEEIDNGYFVYISFRSSNNIIRYRVDSASNEFESVPDLIADFNSADTGDGVGLIDIKFDASGRLFASTARLGGVWDLGIPNPQKPFYADTTMRPSVDLWDLIAKGIKCSNILFDLNSDMYICSGYGGGTVFVASGSTP